MAIVWWTERNEVEERSRRVVLKRGNWKTDKVKAALPTKDFGMFMLVEREAKLVSQGMRGVAGKREPHMSE